MESISASRGPTPRCTAPASFLSYSAYKFFYLAAILLTASEVTAQRTENINFDTAGNNTCLAANMFDANVDYFPIKVVNDTSIHYDPFYTKSYKIMSNTNADAFNMAGPRNESYVLYQCGAPVPENCKSNAGVAGSDRTACFSVPVKSIGVEETVAMTFFEVLGLINTIRYTASLQYAVSPCIQKWAKIQAAKGINISLSDDPATAAKQKAEVDVYFQSSGNYSDNTVFHSETSDKGALPRPDWLGFFASFFNMEAEYKDYMNGLTTRWNELANKTATLSPKPVIAFVWKNDWDPTAVDYQVVLPPYMNDSITAAGAIPLEKKTFTNVADLKAYIKNAAIVIDQAVNITVDDFLKKYNFTANDEFAFLKDKTVYAIDKRMSATGGSDWYESVLIKPDVVLRDLVTMAHPGVLDRERTYIRNIYNEKITILTADDCKSDLELLAKPSNQTGSGATAKPSPAPFVAPALSVLVAAVATVVVALA